MEHPHLQVEIGYGFRSFCALVHNSLAFRRWRRRRSRSSRVFRPRSSHVSSWASSWFVNVEVNKPRRSRRWNRAFWL